MVVEGMQIAPGVHHAHQQTLTRVHAWQGVVRLGWQPIHIIVKFGVWPIAAIDKPHAGFDGGGVYNNRQPGVHQAIHGPVNRRVHFGQHEQSFAVIAGTAISIGLTGGMTRASSIREPRGPHNDGPHQAHFNLQIGIGTAVILVSARLGCNKGVSRATHHGVLTKRHCGRFTRQQTRVATGCGHTLLAGEHNRHRYRQSVVKKNFDRVALIHDKCRARVLHGVIRAMRIAPGVVAVTVGCADEVSPRGKVEGSRVSIRRTRVFSCPSGNKRVRLPTQAHHQGSKPRMQHSGQMFEKFDPVHGASPD